MCKYRAIMLGESKGENEVVGGAVSKCVFVFFFQAEDGIRDRDG